eukprot:scaffold2126_cov417-Prasinococcus_capsulatus_cf.AAC.6
MMFSLIDGRPMVGRSLSRSGRGPRLGGGSCKALARAAVVQPPCSSASGPCGERVAAGEAGLCAAPPRTDARGLCSPRRRCPPATGRAAEGPPEGRSLRPEP